jgi:hypothetical protein
MASNRSADFVKAAAEDMLQGSGVPELEERVLGFLFEAAAGLKLVAILDDMGRLMNEVRGLLWLGGVAVEVTAYGWTWTYLEGVQCALRHTQHLWHSMMLAGYGFSNCKHALCTALSLRNPSLNLSTCPMVAPIT